MKNKTLSLISVILAALSVMMAAVTLKLRFDENRDEEISETEAVATEEGEEMTSPTSE